MRIVVGYWQYLEYVLDDMLEDWGVTCPEHRRAVEDDYWRYLEGMGAHLHRALTAWLRERGLAEVEVVVRKDERVGPNLFIVWFEPEDGWGEHIADEIDDVVDAAHLEWLERTDPWVPDYDRIDEEHERRCTICARVESEGSEILSVPLLAD